MPSWRRRATQTGKKSGGGYAPRNGEGSTQEGRVETAKKGGVIGPIKKGAGHGRAEQRTRRTRHDVEAAEAEDGLKGPLASRISPQIKGKQRGGGDALASSGRSARKIWETWPPKNQIHKHDCRGKTTQPWAKTRISVARREEIVDGEKKTFAKRSVHEEQARFVLWGG